ncbi:MAG: SLBB domain-containing protein [Alphaproteobacteria bacterium]|uniref:SLBB domain-containing protein n=1 Tax=Candidatus Nitrobium versatile TaxID=2884831 RepID=A0A953SIK5_9BACT|nr:SLBB domain-containing protein [Candidatus Nitrobium versatile]
MTMKRLIALLILFVFPVNSIAFELQTIPVPTVQSSASPTTIGVQPPSPAAGGQTAPQQSPSSQTVSPQEQPGLKKPYEEKMSEVEQFIKIAGSKGSSAVSSDIKQFGYDLFDGSPSSFAPVERVPVGPDYVIGPGDEVKITLWGNIDGTMNLTVDRDGTVSLPKVGVLGVTGLTFKELKETLHKELSKYYVGFQMNVSLGSLKTIRVYVVGNANRPGAYTVSSLSTLVTALFDTGGPSKTGTMRDIQVKRNGKTIVHFDLYDFLLKGDKTKDIRLMPEDVIFIPPVGHLAGIAGNVKNPAIYELKGEIKLLELIQMAGGLNSLAFKGRIQVQRNESNQFRTIFEGDLIDMEENAEKNFSLKDGDLVKIFSIIETKNTAMIHGAVATPGEFGVTPGVTRVKDVISLAGGLLYYASDKAEITRVRVTQAGPQTERILVDIAKAMEGDASNNIALEVNDYLFVRSVPEWRLYRTVTVQGEVRYPGTYTIKKGERLSSLLERAGGYTGSAYLRGAFFTRESVKELQRKSLEEMIGRLEIEMYGSGATAASAAVSKEELDAKKIEAEQKARLLEKLKAAKPTGRLTVRLAHLRLLKGSEYDVELEEGDSLYIPTTSNVVNVVGSVMTNGTFIYSDALSYKEYIEMAGGYARYADTSNIYILKADGSARKVSSGWVNWNPLKSRWEMTAFGEKEKELEAGDTVVVPQKTEKVAWLREFKDITQILMQLAVTAGVVLQLY